MIDLFYPPKPHELQNRMPDYVHLIKDDPDETIEVSPYNKRLAQMRAWHERKRAKECGPEA